MKTPGEQGDGVEPGQISSENPSSPRDRSIDVGWVGKVFRKMVPRAPELPMPTPNSETVTEYARKLAEYRRSLEDDAAGVARELARTGGG